MLAILKKLVPLLVLQMLCTIQAGAADGPPSSLMSIVKQAGQDNLQIMMAFSHLPVYQVIPSGKGMKVILENTVTAPSFKNLTLDEIVTSVEQTTENTTTILIYSFNRTTLQVESSFSVNNAASGEVGKEDNQPLVQLSLNISMRPMAAAAEETASESQIVIHPLAASVPPSTKVEIEKKIPAISSVPDAASVTTVAPPPPADEKNQPDKSAMADATDTATQPISIKTEKNLPMPIIISRTMRAKQSASSPYEGNWSEFFSDYEVPINLSPPLEYTLPAFPVLNLLPRTADNRSLDAAIDQGKFGNWDQALIHLKNVESSTVRRQVQEDADLLSGEILIRQKRYDEAIEALAKLKFNLSAQYLKIYAIAASGHPYNAEYELGQQDELKALHPLKPYFVLLQIEISLATEQYEKALAILNANETPWPAEISDMIELRCADTKHALGKYTEALEIYQSLLKKSFNISNHTSSLAGLADSSYKLKDYSAALEHYTTLQLRLEGRQGQDLASFIAAICRFKLEGAEQLLPLLQNITAVFPGSDGGYRARMKINDLTVLAERDADEKKEDIAAAVEYGEIAGSAYSRELREEAAFKQILVLFFKGELERANQYLQAFLRDYASGTLHPHAEALQMQILPLIIENSIKAKDYLQALILAEQNRDLLISGRVNGDFLGELGLAFASLAIWSRAIRVYRYMLDIAKGTPAEEGVYLPLVEALYNKEDYQLIKEYADQYRQKYPMGKDRDRIYYLQLSSLQKSGMINEAVSLLNQSNMPQNQELDILAGKIFWEIKEYAETEKYLARAMGDNLNDAAPDIILLRAEALFQTGDIEKALPLYEHLLERESFFDQATYRSAQIRLAMQNTTIGLKLLSNLAEKGNNPLWRKMASETLALESF